MAVLGYDYLNPRHDGPTAAIAQQIDSNLKDNSSIGNAFEPVPLHTNFVIFGVDDDRTRTDFMMAGTFESENNVISLISMPRDTYVNMPKERRDILKKEGRWTPAEGVMKLTEVNAYAGKDLGLQFAVKQIEDILGIKIEYYALINTESFRYLVDEIGGVEFDVPQRMYYNDPEQKLYIDLQPGLQILNGADAEGLVRYRKSDANNPISKGYARGDLGRVAVQQDFMKALISQLVAKDKIVSNAPAMLNTFLKYVDTNFSLADGLKYVRFMSKISSDKIMTYTLPGKDDYIGGVSYFLHDSVETAKLAEKVFYSKYSPEETEDEE